MTSNKLPGLEEMAAEMRGLEEMAAALARARPQASTTNEPPQKNASATEIASVESGPVGPAVAAPTADEAARERTDNNNLPPSPLVSLDLDTAIRLRWVLRDIKGKRTKLSPANPDDLRTLVKMALVEIRDNVPMLTNKGHWALD